MRSLLGNQLKSCTYGLNLVDDITAIFLVTGSFLTFLITIYSRYYLHKENGYKRFFNTILLFFLGYNITIFSGNFETLFTGWELIGISSFLLVAFYRHRYLPVKNAVKVFSIYRLGDLGIVLTIWASHHLWSENITFIKLRNYELVHEYLSSHSGIGIFISIMLLLAASVKSAQYPFSFWLPRAMEGPTPSSAIFYGSLSVHFGAFLLLRTFPFWEHQILIRFVIAFIGITSSILGYMCSRIQPTIKSRIAYSSISQIGIIFVEIALGLEWLALFHFMGNAFLRTYQLLVSPSIVSYLIRDQFYNYHPDRKTWENHLPSRIQSKLYFLSLNEFYMDSFIKKWIFSPFKRLGSKLDFVSSRNFFIIMVPSFFISWFGYSFQSQLPFSIVRILPEFFSLLSLLMVCRAFTERSSPILPFLLVVFSHFWLALAISFNEKFSFDHILIYLSGVIVGGLIGLFCLFYIQKKEKSFFSLNVHSGFFTHYPAIEFVFFLSCLSIMGFPISGSFLGEDLVFSHIREDEFLLAILSSLVYIFGGIALIRLYARLFLGPSIRNLSSKTLFSG